MTLKDLKNTVDLLYDDKDNIDKKVEILINYKPMAAYEIIEADYIGKCFDGNISRIMINTK